MSTSDNGKNDLGTLEAGLKVAFDLLAGESEVIDALALAWPDYRARARVAVRFGEDRTDAVQGMCISYCALLMKYHEARDLGRRAVDLEAAADEAERLADEIKATAAKQSKPKDAGYHNPFSEND